MLEKQGTCKFSTRFESYSAWSLHVLPFSNMGSSLLPLFSRSCAEIWKCGHFYQQVVLLGQYFNVRTSTQYPCSHNTIYTDFILFNQLLENYIFVRYKAICTIFIDNFVDNPCVVRFILLFRK